MCVRSIGALTASSPHLATRIQCIISRRCFADSDMTHAISASTEPNSGTGNEHRDRSKSSISVSRFYHAQSQMCRQNLSPIHAASIPTTTAATRHTPINTGTDAPRYHPPLRPARNPKTAPQVNRTDRPNQSGGPSGSPCKRDGRRWFTRLTQPLPTRHAEPLRLTVKRTSKARLDET